MHSNIIGDVLGDGFGRDKRGNYYELGKPHSVATQARVLALWQNEPQLTWDQLSEMTGPSVSSCKRYIKKFEQDRQIGPNPCCPNPIIKMGDDEYLSLYDTYLENPAYQLNDYKFILKKDLGIDISESQLCRIFQDLQLTLKKPQILRRERFEFRDGAIIVNVVVI